MYNLKVIKLIPTNSSFEQYCYYNVLYKIGKHIVSDIKEIARTRHATTSIQTDSILSWRLLFHIFFK